MLTILMSTGLVYDIHCMYIVCAKVFGAVRRWLAKISLLCRYIYMTLLAALLRLTALALNQIS